MLWRSRLPRVLPISKNLPLLWPCHCIIFDFRFSTSGSAVDNCATAHESTGRIEWPVSVEKKEEEDDFFFYFWLPDHRPTGLLLLTFPWIPSPFLRIAAYFKFFAQELKIALNRQMRQKYVYDSKIPQFDRLNSFQTPLFRTAEQNALLSAMNE